LLILAFWATGKAGTDVVVINDVDKRSAVPKNSSLPRDHARAPNRDVCGHRQAVSPHCRCIYI
jgi:hypothetical protein